MTTTLPIVGLTRHRLDGFRAALSEQRTFRIRQLTEFASSDAVAIEAYEDPIGVATSTLTNAARFALTEADAALSRLDKGSCGSCLVCGNPIPIERLEIMPMASLCMPRQRATETGNR